jgi:vacuolar-type H+-ATPase subunit E/Vma4
MKSNSPLYDGILMSAKAEANAILEKGEKDCAELKKSYEKKIREAKEHEQHLLDKRLEEIKQTRENHIKNIERSHQGELMKELRKYAQRALFEEMAARIATPSYAQALIYWIAEGAIALEADNVKVASSKNEKLSDEMIEQAITIVEKVVSRKVKIQRESTPLSTQGVVVSTMDGKIAYNNTINVRFMRLRAEFERVLEGSV